MMMNYEISDEEKKLIVALADSILIVLGSPFASMFPIKKERVEKIKALKQKFQ